MFLSLWVFLTVFPDSMASGSASWANLARDLPDWMSDSPGYTGEPLQSYHTFFNLPADSGDFHYRIGTLESESRKIVIQSWSRPGSTETILIGHGYLDHTGLQARTIRYFLQQGMNVVAYDLPGHGLSTGKRMEIDSIGAYSVVLGQVADLIHKEIPGTLHYLGHSTSCLAAVNLFARGKDPFDRVIFIAPLVRHWMWQAGMWSQPLVNLLGVRSVPRIPANLTGDDTFMTLLRTDPLRSDRVPVSWALALYDWDGKRPRGVISGRKITVIQGTFDTVVAASWNLDYLKTVFPGLTCYWIPGGRHHLLNEAPALRDQVFGLIDREFGFSSGTTR